MTSWTIYWITRLDVLHDINQFILGSGLSISGIFIIVAAMENAIKPIYIKWIKISISLILLGALIHFFTPTTKEAVAIYLVTKITSGVIL